MLRHRTNKKMYKKYHTTLHFYEILIPTPKNNNIYYFI